jgi:hypothetical protein
MKPADVVVFSSLNAVEAHLVRSLLTREGIPSRLRNGMLTSLAGELPMNEVRAEVLVRPEHEAAAEAVVAETRRPAGEDRTCPDCAEENPSEFELCWRCGADLPDWRPYRLHLVSH